MSEQMSEKVEAETQQQQGIAPLLVGAAAAAVAGALAVVARKALSGGDDAGPGSSSGETESETGSTSFDDVGQVADDLEGLVAEFRSQSGERDFHRLIEIADTISEYADQAADAFSDAVGSQSAEGEESGRRVTDELMSRIRDITGGETAQAGPGASAQSPEKKSRS
jgi:hypothetical protein